MKKNLVFAIITCLALLPSTIYAAPSVDEIVNKANIAAFYQGDDGQATVEMEIIDAEGRVRNREFIILRKDQRDGGKQKFYVYFKRPSDVKNMVFMVHKNIETEDDRWLYLPALDLVKRISSGDKRTSFAGSHFLYEDISGRSTDSDLHELIEETPTHYIIKNVPKDKDVKFDYYLVHVNKTTFLPELIEYFNKDQKYKTIEALETKEIDGLITVTKMQVADLINGGKTISTISKIKYNINIDESIFTERYLRQPPRKWLR